MGKLIDKFIRDNEHQIIRAGKLLRRYGNVSNYSTVEEQTNRDRANRIFNVIALKLGCKPQTLNAAIVRLTLHYRFVLKRHNIL